MPSRSPLPRRRAAPQRALALATTLAAVVGLAPAAALGLSAGAGAKPGAPCPRPNARARTKAGTLVCTRAGTRAAWRRAPVAVSAGSAPITPACTAQIAGGIEALFSGDMAATLQAVEACQKNTGKTAVVTASPFDLRGIASISKYRSCVGHDFAEGTKDGQVTSDDPTYERFRSMKHYIVPLADAAGDRTNVYAPFDGIVAGVIPESGRTSTGGSLANPGDQIHVVPYANPCQVQAYGFFAGPPSPDDFVTVQH